MVNTIVRKDLWQRLNNVTSKDWEKAGKRMRGVKVNPAGGKGSHCVFRDVSNLDKTNPNSLITTIIKKTYKQANHTIFKNIMAFGIPEDEIWRALKFLK
ncbi:MAG: hypothetical protein L6275_00550 [Candidatus Portnoybacteria bacterium]|nr:hypothetical protein [Candidatus Portnoybacteria bacterium]